MLIPSMTLAAIVSIIKDIVTGSAAVFAAWVAYQGLKTWRRQLRGQTDYQLARRLLKAVYIVRDEIANVRNPLIVSNEVREAIKAKAKEEGTDPTTALENASVSNEPVVYDNRWRRLCDKVAELNVELLEAEVSWKDAKEHTQPLVDVIKTLGLGIRQRLEQLDPGRGRVRLTPEQMKENDDIIYRWGKGNVFTETVEKAVERIETFLKPHLTLTPNEEPSFWADFRRFIAQIESAASNQGEAP